MFLNIHFYPIESTILANKPLTDWFIKNQDWMVYLDLIHMGCLHFENSGFVSNDIRILGKMANAALTWLEQDSPLTQKEKALRAAQSIAEIYNLSKEELSQAAQEQYKIEVETLDNMKPNEAKTLSKHNENKTKDLV